MQEHALKISFRLLFIRKQHKENKSRARCADKSLIHQTLKEQQQQAKNWKEETSANTKTDLTKAEQPTKTAHRHPKALPNLQGNIDY